MLILSAVGAFWASPAAAKPPPQKPSLIVEGVSGNGLLSITEEKPAAPSLRLQLVDAGRAGLLEEPAWRLERDGDAVSGKRAKLSLPLGSTTVFALGGKVSRRIGSTMPDPVEGPAGIAGSKMDSGRVYGAGLERRLGPFEVTATYQYSRISAGEAGDGVGSDRAKSHALRAAARLRFRN